MAEKMMPHRPKENANPPDPKEGRTRAKTRHWAFVGVGAISIVAAVAVGVWAPISTAGDNTMNWPLLVPPVIAAMLVGALGWLAVYVLLPPKGARRD